MRRWIGRTTSGAIVIVLARLVGGCAGEAPPGPAGAHAQRTPDHAPADAGGASVPPGPSMLEIGFGGYVADGAAIRCFNNAPIGAGVVMDREVVDLTAQCALLDDGSIRCWSESAGSAALSTVSGLPPVVALSSGYAVTRAGEVWRWSRPRGEGAPAVVSRIEGISGAVRVASCFGHACAVRREGQLVCWGMEGFDELGFEDRSRVGEPAPGEIPGVDDAVDVAVGENASTCILRRSGVVSCLGGIVGQADAAHRAFVDLQGLVGARQLSLSGRHGCAIDGASHVLCFGDNTYGQLGDGTTERSLDRARQVRGLERATAVDVSGWSSCAISDGGRPSCWGGGTGFGDWSSLQEPILEPVEVPGLVATRLFALGHTTCALTRAGELRCFGELPDTPHGLEGMAGPRPVALPDLAHLRELVGSPQDTRGACGLWEGGLARCWNRLPGDREVPPTLVHGQVDSLALEMTGLFERRSTGELLYFTPFPTIAGAFVEEAALAGVAEAVAVSADEFGCALLRSGRVSCFDCEDRTCGPGFPEVPEDHPVPHVLGRIARAAEVDVGGDGGCVLTTDGRVTCWGLLLIDGDRWSPVDLGLSSIVDVEVGGIVTCALSQSGELSCFGVLYDDGTTPDSMTAVHSVLSGVAEVAAGEQHACARTTEGRVLCLGINDHGELGGPPRFRVQAPIALELGDPRALSSLPR